MENLLHNFFVSLKLISVLRWSYVYIITKDVCMHIYSSLCTSYPVYREKGRWLTLHYVVILTWFLWKVKMAFLVGLSPISFSSSIVKVIWFAVTMLQSLACSMLSPFIHLYLLSFYLCSALLSLCTYSMLTQLIPNVSHFPSLYKKRKQIFPKWSPTIVVTQLVYVYKNMSFKFIFIYDMI